MLTFRWIGLSLGITAGLAAGLLLVGCGEGKSVSGPGTQAKREKASGESHSHAAPHGGVVKTIGDYHAEIVSSKGAITLYVLGGNENKSHPIAASSITAQVQVKGEGKFTPVQLKAA